MTGRPDKINKPIWIEHTATDLDGAKSFYKSLFGWETQNPQGGMPFGVIGLPQEQ